MSDSDLPDSKRSWSGEFIPVHFADTGVDIWVLEGDCVMRAAVGSAQKVRSICSGKSQCGACMVEVISGDLPPPDAAERTMLARGLFSPGHGGQLRLSCQIYPRSPLVLATPLPRK